MVTFEHGYEGEINGVYLVMSVSFHFLFKARQKMNNIFLYTLFSS